MQREKVLFVRAPNLYKSEQWKKQGVLRTPTNLALLSSYIRTFGDYEPEILDFELKDLNTIQSIANEILSKNSRYVCFSTLTPRFPTILKLCQELKKQSPEIITVLGGPHISGRPNDCSYFGIDYGITGEGERGLLKLLNSLKFKTNPAEVPNLVYKLNGQIITNPRAPLIENLDALPLPAWDLLDMKEYKDPPFFREEPHAGVFTTRGCPNDCIFCASKVTWQRKLRFRSVDNVLSEFRGLVEKYGVHNLYFYDDHFATRASRTLDLCNRMIEEELNMKYIIQARADSINPELARALKKSGCISAAVGVESGNEEMLKYIRKKETKDEIRRAVNILKAEGVPITTSFIIGLPGDTHKTIRETIDFARELDTEQMKFMLLTPVPGTDVYEMAVKKGLLDPNNFEQMEKTTFYDTTAVNLSDVSIKELLKYQDEAYRLLDKK
jgi:radical SAM superfamily enzyme YgiQ (UPF0313 family)